MVFVACGYEDAVNLILESLNDDCIYSQIHKILTFKPTLKKPPRKTTFHIPTVKKQLILALGISVVVFPKGGIFFL